MGNEKGIVNMKNHYKDMPESLKGTYGDFSRNFGFSWKEFVATASGLTIEKASWINAPMVSECFMNLECKYVWEKEIVPGDDHVMLCLEVIGIHIDEDHMPDRTGENGILYNIHYQMNPEKVTKTGHDYAAILKKKIDVMEY